MTPPPHDLHPCQGCFLQEHRSGRVCPAARDTYGLPDVAEEQRRAELLRAAILQDAPTGLSLIELVRQEAQARQLGPSRSAPLALPPAPASSLSHDSRKEAAYDIAVPSRTSR